MGEVTYEVRGTVDGISRVVGSAVQGEEPGTYVTTIFDEFKGALIEDIKVLKKQDAKAEKAETR